jgi:hypothetical protein
MATDAFWGPFLNDHGRDSEEESAFLGYLSTHHIPANAEVGVLHEAYGEFHAWMTASYGQEATGEAATFRLPGTPAPAPVPPTPALLPKSAHANPTLETPMQAATRPPELRAEAPSVEPQASTQATSDPQPPPGSGQSRPDDPSDPDRTPGRRRP